MATRIKGRDKEGIWILDSCVSGNVVSGTMVLSSSVLMTGLVGVASIVGVGVGVGVGVDSL